MKIIDAHKVQMKLLEECQNIRHFNKDRKKSQIFADGLDFAWVMLDNQPTVKAIPVEQLLSILPKYDDYIHMKTYPHNETMENIYSEGHEDGWNACLKAIKEELDYWEKENENR